MNWFTKVTNDITAVVDYINYCYSELASAKSDVKINGILEKNARDLPYVIEHRFNQLQEIEAILEYYNIELRKTRSHLYRQYLEKYNRQLTSRDVEKYIDGEDEVVGLQHVINEISLVRNQFLGLIKGLDNKSFQINNIVKLRAAGLDDASI